jgi:hypothetical protein
LTEPLRGLVKGLYLPIYQTIFPNHSGAFVGRLLQEDFSLFSPRVAGDRDGMLNELAFAILEEGLDRKDDVDEPEYRGLFVRRSADATTLADEWRVEVGDALDGTKLRRPEADETRAVPDPPLAVPSADSAVGVSDDEFATSVDFDREERFDPFEATVGEHVVIVPAGKKYFRARIHRSRGKGERLTAAEMGAPPKTAAAASRASREGVPTLFLASNVATAVAEVRATEGEQVAVAPVRLSRELRLLDLRRVPSVENPFDNPHSLAWRYEQVELLYLLGEDMSRPVEPGQGKKYVPSQLLCAKLKTAGYDGIIYSSRRGSGFNLAVFDVLAATPGVPKYVRARGSIAAAADDSSDEWPY